MNGILSYAAPRTGSRKPTTLGIVSTGIATVVFALPSAVSGASALLQMLYSRPGKTPFSIDLGLLVVLVPTLLMLLLPLLGLLFGGLSVAVHRRSCECSMIGMVANIGGLLAGFGAVYMW